MSFFDVKNLNNCVSSSLLLVEICDCGNGELRPMGNIENVVIGAYLLNMFMLNNLRRDQFIVSYGLKESLVEFFLVSMHLQRDLKCVGGYKNCP